jgi:hypothetical protein
MTYYVERRSVVRLYYKAKGRLMLKDGGGWGGDVAAHKPLHQKDSADGFRTTFDLGTLILTLAGDGCQK